MVLNIICRCESIFSYDVRYMCMSYILFVNADDIINYKVISSIPEENRLTSTCMSLCNVYSPSLSCRICSEI